MSVCAACSTENPDGFRFCGSCGTALRPSAPAREVRKVVTIVFCDLTGSTALGDRTDPEALRTTMRGYYDEMRAILERHGGTVEKFVGDAVMAVFGVPVSREDDALRAVRAAWEMRRAVTALGLQARIGANTGEVVTGEGDTLVTGDAVNVAARLEQAAAAGELLIGDATRQLVRDAVEVEPVEVSAKGKPEPLRAFRVVALDPEASGVARRLDSPLVGRERELAALRQAWERVVSEHSCHLFTLLGTAGVGKSRLVAEFLDGLDATILRGQCLAYGDGITLWPVIGVLKQIGAEDAIERITGTLSANELFWVVRSRLEETASNRPLVVVFEDIHWGEPAFLDLIDHIGDLSRGAPILLLCVARPELLDERPGWAGGKLNATTTLLEPLTAQEAERLIDALDGGLDERLRDRIVAAAGGNPLYAEEMLALAREDGEVRAPSTVQALLQARLDRLPPDQRAVIERGAVEGEVFHRLAVVELSGNAVDEELAGLVRKELIRPERATLADDEAFRFRHLLIRDAAYDALPKEARAGLHERFARWLEGRTGLLELDEIVGYHLEQAARYRAELGRSDEPIARAAAARLGAAGLGALRREDLSAATNLIGRALTLLPAGDRERWPLVRSLASALVWSEEQELLGRLIAELEADDDERVSMHGRVLRANRDSQHDPDATLVTEALETFDRHGDRAGLGEVWLLRAIFSWGRCRAAETVEALDRAVALGGSGDLGITARAYSLMMGPLTHGPFGPAFVRERLRRAAAHRPDRFILHASHIAEATLLRKEGRFDEAHAEWERGDAILGELGLGLLRAVLVQIPAEIAFARGDYERARALYRKAYEELGRLNERVFRSTVAVVLAEVDYTLGDLESAERLALEGEKMGGPEDLTNMMLGPALRARIAVDRGDPDRAESLIRRALAASDGTDLSPVRATVFESLAYVRRAQGRIEEARAAVESWIAELERHGDTVLIERARGLLVEL